ncbi:MAG TPA: hypothetical protein VGX68_04840 [Thermoanaerobaculia bacterium]|jgi:hypothetical protein|nr:hypothetical protein [Thermoanaerobaculia bacterium]
MRFPSPLKKALAAAAGLLVLGCGTAVYRHHVIVDVDDPAGRLGSPPVAVSVFDHQMGYSADWAQRSMGSASPGRPYSTSLSTTGTATIASSSLPQRVSLSIAVPGLSEEGYFLFEAELPAEQERRGTASFVRYGSYFPDAGAPSLQIRYRSTAEPQGWRIDVTLTPDSPTR